MTKDLYKMTKQALVAQCQRLESENENLQDELDRLSDCYTEMESEWADAINTLDNFEGIKDIEFFKFRLIHENLLTPQLESFIEEYLKYYNK